LTVVDRRRGHRGGHDRREDRGRAPVTVQPVRRRSKHHCRRPLRVRMRCRHRPVTAVAWAGSFVLRPGTRVPRTPGHVGPREATAAGPPGATWPPDGTPCSHTYLLTRICQATTLFPPDRSEASAMSASTLRRRAAVLLVTGGLAVTAACSPIDSSGGDDNGAGQGQIRPGGELRVALA